MRKKITLVGIYTSAILVVGCSAPQQGGKITYVNPQTVKPLTLGLEYKDFQNAALKLVQKLLKSGVFEKPKKGKYVLAVATIINDTTQRIDVDQLLADIKEALMQSGKVVFTAAVSTADEDRMLKEIRKLRKNPAFNPKTLPKKGTLVAPEYLLSGKIIQRTYYSGDKKYVEYYFILKLIDTKTGLLVWEGKEVIGKMASADTPTW